MIRHQKKGEEHRMECIWYHIVDELNVRYCLNAKGFAMELFQGEKTNR